MLFSTQLNQGFFLWLLTFLPVGNTHLVCSAGISFGRGVRALSCGIMVMDNQAFLHRHVRVADLQNYFWMCCLLTIVTHPPSLPPSLPFFFSPISKLLLPTQFQGAAL